MYDLEKMPKKRETRKLKKRWNDLIKEFDKFNKLEMTHAETYNLAEYQKEAQAIRRTETLASMATAFYLYALDIIRKPTTQEELEEMEKMTKAELLAHRKEINFYNELREIAKEASVNAELLRQEHRAKN